MIKWFLIISIFCSFTANAQELTPTQIAAINKADSIALAAWNLALKNAIYSLNSALGKTNTVLVAKNRAQDSIIGLMKISIKSLSDTNISQNKTLVSLIAKNLAQDKLITALTAKNKSEDSLILIMQKQIAAIKLVSDKAALDASQFSTLSAQTGSITLKASTKLKNTYIVAVDTAITNPVKTIPKINSILLAQDARIKAVELIKAEPKGPASKITIKNTNKDLTIKIE